MHKHYLSLFIGLFVIVPVVLYNDLFYVRSLVVDGIAQQLATVVGISAAVPENEFNTLAQQLTDKERELAAREGLLEEKEAALLEDLRKERADNKKTAIFVSLLGLLLLALILFNFYSDWKRRS